MKKAILILAAFLWGAFTASAQSLNEKYNKKRPVVVVCDWDKPPYEFLDDNGNPAGSNIDVLNAVFSELQLPVEYVMKEWSIALKNFEHGNADIILANARRYRSGNYYVSDNVVNYNRICVATHADSTRMVSLRQLEREGAVFKPGDYSSNYFMDGDTINTAFMEFQTPKVALMGILNDDYKYYVWGEEPLKWKIKELNLEGIALNDVGIPISEIHIVGHDLQLIEAIDDQYSRLKQRGDVSLLQDKWLHPERVKDETSPIALFVVLGAILLLGLIYLFSRLAKAHVKIAARQSTELNEMMNKALHMGNIKVMVYDILNDRMTNSYGDILPAKGLTLEEFTHRIHPNQQEEFTRKMSRMIEGRERHFELDKRWNKGTDEKPVWLNFHGQAISELNSDGQPVYVVNTILDVTHDMEEDKAARELVRKYERMTNIPFIAMSFYDKDGWLIDLNDNMKELCGIDAVNPDARRFWEKSCIFDFPQFRDAYSPDDREDSFFCQHLNYPQYGVDSYIECQVRPLFNAEGDIVNYFINTFDVTEQQQYHHQIHQMVREREHINQTRILHQQRLRHLCEGSMRYIMRSNIKDKTIAFYRSFDTPEYVDQFDEFLQLVDEAQRPQLQQILYDTESREPRQLVVRLRERLPGMVLSITFRPVFDEAGSIIGHQGMSSDISQLWQARELLARQARQTNDSLKLKSSYLPSMVHEVRTPLNAVIGFSTVLSSIGESNPERLQQMIAAFVANAAKSTGQEHVRVGYRYEKNGIYLYCEDTGMGIPKDKQQIVFDSIVKLDELAQGTGMGRAVCKSIVDHLEGEAGVSSPGSGSTFWAWIPCEHTGE